MLRNLLSLMFFCIVFCVDMYAQLSGVITSDMGDTLSYASVYVEGTSKGTIANGEGAYKLDLEPGAYRVVYQFIGFQKKVVAIDLSSGSNVQDVVLSESSYLLDDVIIAADAEDPAYAIMRKAIKNREQNKNLIKSYTADVYVKGIVKMLDAPTSIFGREIGNMDGILDSTRQGILYLSESKAKVWYEQPDRVKEEMYSSIVSGDDSGINANQFNNSRFDFYKEYQQFNRSLISPIADRALTYYKFRLLGTSYDSDGRLVNKIKVIPKSEYQPVFSGNIYIYEDQWNIHSLDLAFTGKTVKQKMFDTIRVQQIFVPLEGFKAYPMQSQKMFFEASLFGFKVGGNFNYILSDYQLNIDIPESTFGSELFKMEKDAVNKDTAFWKAARPIPLTREEKVDYIKKDSLKRLWHSKPYLDSVDHNNNKFKIADLFFGYSFQNSFKNRYYEYNSPIGTVQFNAVEGYSLSANLEARLYDSTENNQWKINPSVRYGFSDKELKASIAVRYRFDRVNRGFIVFSGGRKYAQMDQRNPVMTSLNTMYSLFGKRNLLHLYDRRFVTGGVFKEIFNGLYAQMSFNYENRRILQNNSSLSWGNKIGSYRKNNDIAVDDKVIQTIDFPTHNALIFKTRLVWRPGQKYLSFPDFKSRIQSGSPSFELLHDYALADVSYSKLRLIVLDKNLNVNLYGHLAYSLEGGMFFNKSNTAFPDLFHFMGNETFVNSSSRNLEQFKLMPQYAYATTNNYFAAFVEHHFDGFILDRIPVLRRLGAKLIAGINYMINEDYSFLEYAVGMENISLGPFTFFRIDYAWARDNHSYTDHGIMIGLSTVIGD